MMHRQKAHKALQAAEADNDADRSRGDYANTTALIGIGYAILEVADAIRDRTAEIVSGLRP